MGACLGTLGHAAKGPVAFGAPVRPYEAAKPKSADRPSRVSVCGTLTKYESKVWYSPWSVLYASDLNHAALCCDLKTTLRSRIPDFTKWQQRMSSRH